MDSEELKSYFYNDKVDQDEFQKVTEMFRDAKLAENMKTEQEEFEKMTELEREWELFRRAELNEQLENWIRIKKNWAERKNNK